MTPRTAIIAGVFEQEPQAKRALDALRQAGFSYEQVGLATHGQGKVDLKDELLNLGVPRESANYYAQEYKRGYTVVSVRPDGKEQEAHTILHRYGGYDYEHQTGETQTAAGYQRSTATDQTQNATQTTTNDRQDEFYQPRSLKLREERLNVTKERLQTGEVSLHKEVVAERKTIDVPVTHEEVIIERHAVSGGQVDTTPIGQEEIIRIPVSEEQVTVSKNIVVTGEVEIGKRAVEETQQVSETLKHEKASIEREGKVDIQGENNPRRENNPGRR